MKTSEKEHIWIQNAKQNPQGFAPLYDTYFNAVFGFVYRRTGDKNVTSDLVSQVFMKALLGIKKYELRAVPFKAWLFKIALNEVRMYYRKRAQVQEVIISESAVHLFTQELGSSDDRIDAVLVHLKSLSPDDQEVIELRFFEELSFKEVGSILGVAEDSAKKDCTGQWNA